MPSVQKLCLERTQNLSALPVRLAAKSAHQKAMALVGLVIVYLRFIDGTLVEKSVVLTLLIYCRKGRDDFSNHLWMRLKERFKVWIVAFHPKPLLFFIPL